MEPTTAKIKSITIRIIIHVMLTGGLNSIEIATTCAPIASNHNMPAIRRSRVAFPLLSAVGKKG